MALKKTITKDEHSKLSDDMKKLYAEGEEEDTFVLDVEDEEGDQNAAALRRARDREKAERKKLADKVKDLETKLAKATETDDKRKEKDIATLESEWQEKMAEKETELTGKLSAKDQFIRKQLIQGKAAEIAGKISTVPAIMAKAIADRLTVEFTDDDEPKLVVLDKHGKPSEMKLEKLQQEFVANPEYAAIIIASKGSGSGGPGSKGPGSTVRPPGDSRGGATPPGSQTVNLAKAGRSDLMAHLRSVIPED